MSLDRAHRRRRRWRPVPPGALTGGRRRRPLPARLSRPILLASAVALLGAIVVARVSMIGTPVRVRATSARARAPGTGAQIWAQATGEHSAGVLSATPHLAIHLASRSRNPFATASLRAYLAHRTGNITAAVYDVSSGVTYLYRPGIREQTASIVKVDILATLLHQRQASGGLAAETSGTAQGMIEASDDDDATDLWNLEGGAPEVEAFDVKAGMSQTTPNVAWGLTTTTPRDQLKLLRLVMLPNDLLTLASREYEYELMRHVIASDRWGVSAGLGRGAAVALKNGWLPLPGSGWQVNSVGSVTGSGRRYLIAVMTNRDPTEAYGIATIERVSAAVWTALGGQLVLRLS